MPRAHNLAGNEIGLLTVREIGEPGTGGRRRWRCECQCGAEILATATDLVSERVWACPDCGGPIPKTPRPGLCPVCRCPSDNDALCSAECREARRRGRKAGVDHLPPITRVCEICSEPFIVSRGLVKTCSAACLRERTRRRRLAAWRRRQARDPSITKRMAQQRRQKALADPEYAAKVREWDALKHAKHRQRMKTDPEYAAKHRERVNTRYMEVRVEIQARRRKRLDALGPKELASWLERARTYVRKWRQKWRAELVKDPARHQRFIDYMREYRRQLARQKFLGGVLNAASTLGERLNDTSDGTDSDRQNSLALAGHSGRRIHRIGPAR